MTALQNVTTAMEITGSKENNKDAFALSMLKKSASPNSRPVSGC